MLNNLTVPFLLLCLFSCAQNVNDSVNEIDKTNVNIDESDWIIKTEEDYTIGYPSDWTLQESGVVGISFAIMSPLTSTQDKFSENVNLLIQDLSGQNVKLDQFIEVSERQIESLMTDGHLIKSTRSESDGLSFHKLLYTGKQGVFDLKIQQYCWIENEQAYVLSLTSEEEQFDSIISLGEGILNSFKLTLENQH